MWTVAWPKSEDIMSSGRNRCAYQTGIRVYLFDFKSGARLHLCPVNSTGLETSGCSMEVPVEKLDELIAALQGVKAQLLQKEQAEAQAGVPA